MTAAGGTPGGTVEEEVPPQPVPDPDSAGYWEAAALGHLSIRRCQACGLWCHPPLERCRRCGGETAYEEVSGEGTLYSWITVNRAAVPGFREDVPYLLGMVDLAEQPGLRVAGRLLGIDGSSLRAGLAVRARLVPHPGGRFQVPVFEAAPDR